MLFANVCAGFISSSYGECCLRRFFLCFWFLLGVLCIWRVLVLLVSLLCTRLGFLGCASCWTLPSGGAWWRHYLCNLQGVYLKIHQTACKDFGMNVGFLVWEPYMPALAGQHCPHRYCACVVCWNYGALRRNCRQKNDETFFSLFFWFFSLVGNLGCGFGV